MEWQVDDLDEGDGVEDEEQDAAGQKGPPPSPLSVRPRPVVALYRSWMLAFHFTL